MNQEEIKKMKFLFSAIENYEALVAQNKVVIEEQKALIQHLKDTIEIKDKHISDLTNLINEMLHPE